MKSCGTEGEAGAVWLFRAFFLWGREETPNLSRFTVVSRFIPGAPVGKTSHSPLSPQPSVLLGSNPVSSVPVMATVVGSLSLSLSFLCRLELEKK